MAEIIAEAQAQADMAKAVSEHTTNNKQHITRNEAKRNDTTHK